METTSGLRPGQLVFSKAGRDRGRPFLVVRVLSERFVEVVDGDLRKVGKPKRKNARHLLVTQRRAEEIGNRFDSSRPVKNWEIRKSLAELTGETQPQVETLGTVDPIGSDERERNKH